MSAELLRNQPDKLKQKVYINKCSWVHDWN